MKMCKLAFLAVAAFIAFSPSPANAKCNPLAPHTCFGNSKDLKNNPAIPLHLRVMIQANESKKTIAEHNKDNLREAAVPLSLRVANQANESTLALARQAGKPDPNTQSASANPAVKYATSRGVLNKVGGVGTISMGSMNERRALTAGQ